MSSTSAAPSLLRLPSQQHATPFARVSVARSGAGIRAVAVDLPGFGITPELPPEATNAGLVSFIVDEYQTKPSMRTMLVSPSASGAWALPYIAQLPDPGTGGVRTLSGFVPVAPVGVDSWEGPGSEAVRESLQVRLARTRMLRCAAVRRGLPA